MIHRTFVKVGVVVRVALSTWFRSFEQIVAVDLSATTCLAGTESKPRSSRCASHNALPQNCMVSGSRPPDVDHALAMYDGIRMAKSAPWVSSIEARSASAD